MRPLRETVYDRILAQLGNGPATSIQIAEALGLPLHTSRNALAHLTHNAHKVVAERQSNGKRSGINLYRLSVGTVHRT
jgi:predicted ArsR family transcriptional regulator